MNKKYYISILAVGLFGFAAGFLIGRLNKPEENEEPEELKEPETREEETPEEKPVVEEAIEAIDYDERLKDLEYRSQSDDPEDALDPEEEEELESATIAKEVESYKKEGAIKIISKKTFDDRHIKGFNDVDYSGDEIYYFPDEDFITDEFGGILTPMEKYVGDCLDEHDFKTNDDTELYLTNHPMETDFIVHKVKDLSRDEYFDDTVNYN